MRKYGPARYDLCAAQQGALQIPRSCVAKANVLVMLEKEIEVRRHIRSLFLSLVPEDYAYTQIMQRRAGQPLQGDVYGKVDEHGLWFIKFHVDGATVIMSCHEAEHDIKLLDGRILRRQQ